MATPEDLDAIAVEQDRFREMLEGGSLEADIERRLYNRLEEEYQIQLEKELKQREAVISFLKSRMKALEMEESRKSELSSKKVVQPEVLIRSGPDELSKIKDNLKNLSFGKYVRTIATIQLLICFLICLARADVFCIAIVVCLYACHEHDKKGMATYLALMGFSVIVDVIWLVQHSDSSAFAVTKTFKGTVSFVFAMTVMGLLFKVLVSWPAYQHYRDLPDVKPSEEGTSSAGEVFLQGPLEKAVFGLILLQFGISILNSLVRFDVYVMVLLIFLYALHESDRRAMRGYFVFVIVSIALDIVWITTHAGDVPRESLGWKARASEPELFAFVISIINLVLKVLFIPLAARIYSGLPDVKPSEKKVFAIPQFTQEAPDTSLVNRIRGAVVKVPHSTFLTALSVFQLFICFLESLARLDVFVVVIGIALYAILESDKIALELYMGFMCLSIILDIVWLGIHADAARFEFVAGTVTAMNLVIALVVISIVLKLISIWPALRFRRECPDIKISETGTTIGNKRAAMLGYTKTFKDLRLIDKYSHILYGLAALQLFLFFFESLDRIDPFGLVILALLYGIHEQDRTAIYSYLIAMDFSLILDIVWLSLHSEDLEAIADAARIQEWSAVSDSLQFVYALVIISFLVKLLAHIPALLFLGVCPEVKPSEIGTTADKNTVYESRAATATRYEPSVVAVSPVPAPQELSSYSRDSISVPPPSYLAGSDAPNVLPYVPAYEDKIDQMMADFMNIYGQSLPVKLSRQGPGIYLFGTRRVICKILNDKLVARVGGGYMMIDEFCETYAAVEAEKVRQELSREQQLRR